MDFTISNKEQAQQIVEGVKKNPEGVKELTQDERKIVLRAVDMLNSDDKISPATVMTKTQISGYDVNKWKHTTSVFEKFILSLMPKFIVNLFKGS